MVGLILAFLLLLIVLMVGLYDMVYGEKKKTKVRKEVTILLRQAKVASVLWGFLLVG